MHIKITHHERGNTRFKAEKSTFHLIYFKSRTNEIVCGLTKLNKPMLDIRNFAIINKKYSVTVAHRTNNYTVPHFGMTIFGWVRDLHLLFDIISKLSIFPRFDTEETSGSRTPHPQTSDWCFSWNKSICATSLSILPNFWRYMCPLRHCKIYVVNFGKLCR